MITKSASPGFVTASVALIMSAVVMATTAVVLITANINQQKSTDTRSQAVNGTACHFCSSAKCVAAAGTCNPDNDTCSIDDNCRNDQYKVPFVPKQTCSYGTYSCLSPTVCVKCINMQYYTNGAPNKVTDAAELANCPNACKSTPPAECGYGPYSCLSPSVCVKCVNGHYYNGDTPNQVTDAAELANCPSACKGSCASPNSCTTSANCALTPVSGTCATGQVCCPPVPPCAAPNTCSPACVEASAVGRCDGGLTCCVSVSIKCEDNGGKCVAASNVCTPTTTLNKTCRTSSQKCVTESATCTAPSVHQCFPHSCSSLTPPRASASDCGACPFSNWVCCGDEITIVDRCPQGNSFCSDNGTFNYCKPDRSGYVNQACGPGTTCPQGKTACETVAPLADGTVCLSDPQCRSGHCVTDSDGVRRCGTPPPRYTCAGLCLSPTACDNAAMEPANGTCAAGYSCCKSRPATLLSNGAACTSNTQCVSSHCNPDSNNRQTCGPAPTQSSAKCYPGTKSCLELSPKRLAASTCYPACIPGASICCGQEIVDICPGKCIAPMAFANGNYALAEGTCANSYICVKDGDPLLPAGASCTASLQCIIGLLCIQGKCASASTLVSGLNGPCNHDGFICKPEFTCVNQTCRAPQTAPQPMTSLNRQAGESCGTTSVYDYRCATGLTCLYGYCQLTSSQPAQVDGLVATAQFLNAVTFGAFGDYVTSNVNQNATYEIGTENYDYWERVMNYENWRAATRLGATVTGEVAAGVYIGAAAAGSMSVGTALAAGGSTTNLLLSTGNTAAVCRTAMDYQNNTNCQMAVLQNALAMSGAVTGNAAAAYQVAGKSSTLVSTAATANNTADTIIGAYNTYTYCKQYGTDGTCILFGVTTALGAAEPVVKSVTTINEINAQIGRRNTLTLVTGKVNNWISSLPSQAELASMSPQELASWGAVRNADGEIQWITDQIAIVNRSVDPWWWNTVAVPGDPQLNKTISEIQQAIGNPSEYADGLFLDDIGSHVYQRNQPIYSQTGGNPWAMNDLQASAIRATGQEVPLGHFLSDQPYCVGNVCAQNAMLVQTLGELYGIPTYTTGVTAKSITGDVFSHAVNTYQASPGTLGVVDATWNVSFSSVDNYTNFLKSKGYSNIEIIKPIKLFEQIK